VDAREPENVKKLVETFGYTPVPVLLPCGDFAGKHAIVERKSITDLEASLRDHRLERQLYDMTRDERAAFVVIHGDWHQCRFLTFAQLTGLIASINVRYMIPVVWVRKLEEAVAVACRIIVKADEGKLGVPRVVPVRHYSDKLDRLRKFLGVPLYVARNLAKQYNSVADLCRASEAELQRIEGIGRIRAKKIHALLHMSLLEEE